MTQKSIASRRHRAGFSLVEMIGVLAIIAILAVVIVPKVFSTIASSRVTSTVGSVTSMRTAVAEFAGKYGTVPLTTANTRLDDLFVTAGFLDSRFSVKLGNTATNPAIAGGTWTNAGGTWTNNNAGADQSTESRLIARPVTATGQAPVTAFNAGNANFRLNGGAQGLPTGARVVATAIVGLTGAQARELSLQIDGDTFSQPNATTADQNGKVVYAAPGGTGTTTAYVYVAHQ